MKNYFNHIQYTILLMAVLLFSGSLLAQESQCVRSGNKKEIKGGLELSTFHSLRNKNIAMHGFAADIELYIIRNLGLCGQIETTSYHRSTSSIKTYDNAFAIAGGLCYCFDKEGVVIRSIYGGTSGKTDLKNKYWDTRLTYVPFTKKDKLINLSLGIGFRRSFFSSEAEPNRNFPYFSVGVRL